MKKNFSARKSRKKIIMIIVAVFVSVFVTLLALELGCRSWLKYFVSKKKMTQYCEVNQVIRQPPKTRKYIRHHYLPFIPTPNYTNKKNRHNSLGYRGEEFEIPKPEGVFRIVLLGGSTTYSTAVEDYRKSTAYVLQTFLRENNKSLEVINAGCGRYSTWETLLNLVCRVLDTQPDLVIVYHGINDVHSRLVYPFEMYRGDNSGARVPYDPPQEKPIMQSALIRWVATRLGYRKPIGGLAYLRTHDWLPMNFTLEFRDQKRNHTYPSGIFKKVSAEEMLARNKPIYFKQNLENMVAVCGIHDIDIVLMTFASSPHFTNHPLASSPEYQHAFKEHNEVIREICLQHQIPCHDFARQMPKKVRYWTDGRHLNEEGAELKAKLMAEFLRESDLIPYTFQERQNNPAVIMELPITKNQ